mgnify:CR=1 FL=1
MGHGFLAASADNIDFMIHGIFSYERNAIMGHTVLRRPPVFFRSLGEILPCKGTQLFPIASLLACSVTATAQKQ